MPMLWMTWAAPSSGRPAETALDEAVKSWWPDLHPVASTIGLRVVNAVLEAGGKGVTYEMALRAIPDGLAISLSANGPAVQPIRAQQRKNFIMGETPGCTTEFAFGDTGRRVEVKIKKAS